MLLAAAASQGRWLEFWRKPRGGTLESRGKVRSLVGLCLRRWEFPLHPESFSSYLLFFLITYISLKLPTAFVYQPSWFKVFLVEFPGQISAQRKYSSFKMGFGV